MDQVNTRGHRATGRVPAEMLAEERTRLHAIPDLPHTAALGVTRRVPDNTPMITWRVGLIGCADRQSRWIPGSGGLGRAQL